VTSGVAQTEAQSQVMADTAKKFDSASTNIQSTMSRLMSELTQLNSAWKGVAATKFVEVKEQYNADLKALNTALTETAEAVRTSGTSYDTTDADAAQTVGKTGNSGYTLPL